jgi:hypothetical protein
MVRGRSTPVVFGGHFHVTRFGMFRSRAGLALNPWSTAASPRTAYRHRPYLHTLGVIRTAPPSRSRVKNDYSIIGMLSRGIIPLPLLGGVGVQSSQKNPTLSSLRSDVPPHKGEGKKDVRRNDDDGKWERKHSLFVTLTFSFSASPALRRRLDEGPRCCRSLPSLHPCAAGPPGAGSFQRPPRP